MNITSENLKKSEVKLTVELSELEMEGYYQKALDKLAKQINVKGFRQGHVPREVAEKELNKEFITAHAVDMAIPPSYVEAIKEKKLEPIARPKVNVTSTSPLKFEAIVPLYPEVKLKDYKKITLERQKVELKEDEMSAEMSRLQGFHAHYHDADRPAQIGDRVEVDFQGFDEGGAQLDGTTSKNHPIVIGDKMFVPGFEENLIGMVKDQEKDFKVTFPADYFHTPFQNKVVVFKVKVNRIEERHLPELNAELIKKISGKDMTLDEFKKELRENLLKGREQEEKTRLENSLLEQIEARTEVELAEALVDDEIDFMMEEQKQQIAERGLKWEDYLKAVNKTEHDWHKEKHPDAEKRLKLRFGVQELFKLEKIEVTDEELNKSFEEELKVLASMSYQPNQEEQDMFKNRLRSKLKMEKLIGAFIK
ncbi:trigger factor [Candidatus Peregrinibacteria bacterium]|nr:trigger factor [Candidatus Peregrinibacteria bacterium]